MAAFSINNISRIAIEHGPVTQVPRVNRKNKTNESAPVSKKKVSKDSEDSYLAQSDIMSRLAAEDDYEEIQRNMDGDVLSVTKEGVERVTVKQKEAEELPDEEKGKITEFKGISDDDLETYYLEGKISRTDYMVEMNKREKIEAFRNPDNKKNDSDTDVYSA